MTPTSDTPTPHLCGCDSNKEAVLFILSSTSGLCFAREGLGAGVQEHLQAVWPPLTENQGVEGALKLREGA